MPKERSVNPAQAQRKADKAKQLKKSKAEQQKQRNEKLARRNPDRLQRQLDELEELERAGALRPKDKQDKEDLEKTLKAVKKARETLGQNALESRSSGNRDDARRNDTRSGGQTLGKRQRPYNDDSEATDDDVRAIPMPRDTPPPVPRRRYEARRAGEQPATTEQQQPPKEAVKAQTTYSSAPVMRDLAKEARRFVPAAVAQNTQRVKGQGGKLLEPEEMDKLEQAGYRDAKKAADEAEKEAQYLMMNEEAEAGVGEQDISVDARTRDAETLRQESMSDARKAAEAAEAEAEFRLMMGSIDKGHDGEQVSGQAVEKELRTVEMEEVSDEDL